MKNNILLKVLLAIALAILAGFLTGSEGALGGIRYVDIYGMVGQLFLNALSLVVVPLVCASIITATARMGAEPSFAFLGVKMFGFYMLTSLTAALVGVGGFWLLSSSALIEGGTDFGANVSEMTSMVAQMEGSHLDRVAQMLFRIVPSNILSAAAQGQMLGVIFFSLLFGFFISRIDPQPAAVLLGLWNGVLQVMMKITHLIMKALPVGVFALVAKVAATAGVGAMASVAVYFLMVVVSLLVYSLVVLPLLLWMIGGVNPVLHFKALAPALLTAFSTSSSAVSLPVTLECVEKRAGVSSRICSFAIPLGTSLNMSGGALYLCVASLFIAQAYGHPLPPTTVCLVTVMALLTSMGIAGIPSASLISLMMILQSIGVPVEGVGLIMAVDRILDMFRTTVNVLGNASCAVLLARSEGEEGVLAERRPLYRPID